MMKVLKILAVVTTVVAACFVLSSCSQKQWKVEGLLVSADGTEQLVLEKQSPDGRWFAVDTIKVEKDGIFKFKGDAEEHPEIFRLTYEGQPLYFPVDSVESLHIDANKVAYSTTYRLSGSSAADQMQQVNDLINDVARKKGEQAVATDTDLKRSLAESILRDPAGIVAYYTVSRRVGNTLIFNPADRADLRIIGAVANAYASHRPDDPRAAYLARLFFANRGDAGIASNAETIEATEIRIPPLALLDRDGNLQDLEDVTARGNVVILNFIAYGAEMSPAVNVEMNKIYDQYKSQGLEIYQVGIDDDEFAWRQSSANLPWITVYNSPKDGVKALLNYNVTSIPATFIINRNGELVERVDDLTKLSTTVKRYI